jgi:hypothetical protein
LRLRRSTLPCAHRSPPTALTAHRPRLLLSSLVCYTARARLGQAFGPVATHRKLSFQCSYSRARIFEAVNPTAIDESRTRFQSASLNGYARLPGSCCPIERHPSGSRSSRLNQTRIHPLRQVVLTNHARDLDLPDRDQMRPRRPGPAAITNQLPAYSAGNLQQPTSTENAGHHAGEPHASLRALQLTQRARAARVSPSGLPKFAPALQKEYQCQES